jgi:hypothetical protein
MAEAAATEMLAVAEKASAAVEALADELVAEKAETAAAGAADLASKLKAAKLELSLADNAEERRPLKNKVAELEAALAIVTTASMAAAPQSPPLPPSPVPSNRWRKAASGATRRS